jgi:hypothetical protein
MVRLSEDGMTKMDPPQVHNVKKGYIPKKVLRRKKKGY